MTWIGLPGVLWVLWFFLCQLANPEHRIPQTLRLGCPRRLSRCCPGHLGEFLRLGDPQAWSLPQLGEGHLHRRLRGLSRCQRIKLKRMFMLGIILNLWIIFNFNKNAWVEHRMKLRNNLWVEDNIQLKTNFALGKAFNMRIITSFPFLSKASLPFILVFFLIAGFIVDSKNKGWEPFHFQRTIQGANKALCLGNCNRDFTHTKNAAPI